ncbi:MAG: UDP-N-acetylmuramate dehydrogenase [Hydrocarboniphaga sp.]|uniref:UDP-N-acetylmuramate dehydrogenase n=1 Tax=Hydrocarboniphaga sp. TaxID=2033016 RepID=UPI002602BD65|nr:UDP-N-acetylmuramate dehydrogenase [Hydrocarboniphaga sp.]MDB5969564.1 UDP-N-acetylmuramate dehydrogenase [Hydrocarboniphaga sp.]
MSATIKRNGVRGRLLSKEPLAAHTSWRVGGPADRYFEPADREDLLAFIASLPAREPITWLGLGSNLLVRDGGVRGTVICLHGALDGLASAGDHEIYAEAGVHCARLAKYAQARRRAGLGFMAGIPGTVGGALAMNAGAWGGETWPQVLAVEAVYRDGRSEWLSPGDFQTAYRHVKTPSGVLGFLGARFRVGADPSGEHERVTREWLARRKATQPVGKPTAGSTFRNPPGDHAARLIESCGLKGERIGGAEISTLHANFIVTEAGAIAADVEALIQRVRDVVREKAGVDLQPEVRIVGVAA